MRPCSAIRRRRGHGNADCRLAASRAGKAGAGDGSCRVAAAHRRRSRRVCRCGGRRSYVDVAVLDLPAHLRATGGVALGALVLLVAVHLVSAELVADRLTGPIARATSVPVPLVACYVIAVAALVVGQVSRGAFDPATRSAITYGLAAGFAVSFGVALVQLSWPGRIPRRPRWRSPRAAGPASGRRAANSGAYTPARSQRARRSHSTTARVRPAPVKPARAPTGVVAEHRHDDRDLPPARVGGTGAAEGHLRLPAGDGAAGPPV
jgi:hypothetical protein